MTPKLHNIFSRKNPIIKEQKENLGKIIIDYREKQSLVPAQLKKLGFEIEFQELKIGDYIVKETIIERKTISDFLSSMCNKRLLNQLKELKQFENKLLIIEGIDEQDLYCDNEKNPCRFDNSSSHRVGGKFNVAMGVDGGVSNLQNKINPNSIRGFLLSILLRHKIPTLFTKNSSDTAKFIRLIAKKQTKEISTNYTKKPKNKKEQMQFILESFSGIGPKNAKKLLEKFNNLQNIFGAPQEELQKIIGKKAEIFMLLEEKY